MFAARIIAVIRDMNDLLSIPFFMSFQPAQMITPNIEAPNNKNSPKKGIKNIEVKNPDANPIASE